VWFSLRTRAVDSQYSEPLEPKGGIPAQQSKARGFGFYFSRVQSMRPFLFILLSVCLAGPASALQQPTNPWATIPRPPHAVSAPYDSQAERQLLDLANQARAEAGLVPLQIDEGLMRAARKHSALMASQKQLSHDLPGEPTLPQRLAATSTLQLGAEGENVGLAPSAAEVHRGFMHSPHHRENLLNPDYNVAGFAVVRNGNIVYVTEDFGQDLPSARKVLK
jgi:uncharacterized protein YkwD